MSKPQDRLESIRQVLDSIVRQQPEHDERRCGFVHLYGVSAICVLLALKRGLDPHICALAGMLHDIWSYKTGDSTEHAHYSTIEAETILREAESFTNTEIRSICDAIAHHGRKNELNDSRLSELLKDADVLQHYLYNPTLQDNPALKWQHRLQHILDELGLHGADGHQAFAPRLAPIC